MSDERSTAFALMVIIGPQVSDELALLLTSPGILMINQVGHRRESRKALLAPKTVPFVS